MVKLNAGPALLTQNYFTYYLKFYTIVFSSKNLNPTGTNGMCTMMMISNRKKPIVHLDYINIFQCFKG